jgi:hypothetical protein
MKSYESAVWKYPRLPEQNAGLVFAQSRQVCKPTAQMMFSSHATPYRHIFFDFINDTLLRCFKANCQWKCRDTWISICDPFPSSGFVALMASWLTIDGFGPLLWPLGWLQMDLDPSYGILADYRWIWTPLMASWLTIDGFGPLLWLLSWL